MARLAKNQQLSMQKKLQTYYERNQSASFAARETGVNIKTVCKYYNKWSEDLTESFDADFKIRQEKIKIQTLWFFDRHLCELYDMLDIINSEIKKHSSKSKEIPRYLISQKLQTLNTISEIADAKSALGMAPTIGYSIDDALKERYEELRNKK